MKRITAALICAGAVSATAAAWYALSPFAAVAMCRNWIIDLNAEQASKCIDFPLLRENLKSEIPALIAKQLENDPEIRDNPFASIGMALVLPMASAMIDIYVTPAGLKKAFELAKTNEQSKLDVGNDDGAEEGAAIRSRQLSTSLKRGSFRYRDLNKFEITGTSEDGSGIGLFFDRHGFSEWKLSAVSFSK